MTRLIGCLPAGDRARRFAVAGLVVPAAMAVLAVAVLLWPRTPDALRMGPMLQHVTTNGFFVVWWDESAEGGILRVEDDRGWLGSYPAVRGHIGFVARAAGLQGGRSYRYTVLRVDAAGATSRFGGGEARTAPVGDAPLSFIVFGDSGRGNRAQRRLARTMARYPVDFILHSGDVVYPDGQWEGYSARFFRPYAELLARVPVYPVAGNHDNLTLDGAPWRELFLLPGNGPAGVEPERCYWFGYGNARVVAFDSNLAPETLAERVAPWLRDVLDEQTAGWTFALFHHPPFSARASAAGLAVRDTIVPVFEEQGVDLAFCGHDHWYQRTRALRALPLPHAETAGGVRYVTSGAGSDTTARHAEDAPAFVAAFEPEHCSFTLVDVDGARLRLRQIDASGRVLDDVTWARNRHGAMAALGGKRLNPRL